MCLPPWCVYVCACVWCVRAHALSLSLGLMPTGLAPLPSSLQTVVIVATVLSARQETNLSLGDRPWGQEERRGVPDMASGAVVEPPNLEVRVKAEGPGSCPYPLQLNPTTPTPTNTPPLS